MIFLIKNLLYQIKRFISIFLYSPLVILFRLLNIHVPYFHVDRIGHFLHDPDCFIKEYFLRKGIFPKAILLAPSNIVSNKEASKLWEKYFIVISNATLSRILLPVAFHPLNPLKNKRYTAVFKETSDIYSTFKRWGDRKALFEFSSEQDAIGSSLVKEMGVSSDDWFICIHSREEGYSPSDEHLHSFRNFSFQDFFPAVDYIASMGGICIRMGDKTMLPVSHPNLIDYATCDYKSEFLDLYLASKAKFFLGSNSGAYTLSMIFGVPVAICNLAPLTCVTPGLSDINIPMLLKDKQSQKLISFSDILLSPLEKIRTSEGWVNSNVELIKNSKEDILELTKEQFQRVEGIYPDDKEANTLNEKLKSLYKPGHHCYGVASKMGDHFIKKYF